MKATGLDVTIFKPRPEQQRGHLLSDHMTRGQCIKYYELNGKSSRWTFPLWIICLLDDRVKVAQCLAVERNYSARVALLLKQEVCSLCTLQLRK